MTRVVRRRGTSTRRGVVGLDLSLTGTGIANTDGSLETLKPPVGRTTGDARMAWIRDEVVDRCRGAELVLIERVAYDATVTKAPKEAGDVPQKVKSPSLSMLAGLFHVVTVALWEQQTRYIVATAGQIKIYATGSGKANKTDVVVASAKLLDLDPRDDNQSDAAWMRALGLLALGRPLVDLPDTHTRAVDNLSWDPE